MKIVLLLARTLSMSLEVSDCATKHLVEYEVKSKKHLNKLSGKYFKRDINDIDFELVKPSEMKDLIGSHILVRSAATCCLGDYVCPKCIGATASTNLDIADGLTAFELTSSSNKTSLIAGNSFVKTISSQAQK